MDNHLSAQPCTISRILLVVIIHIRRRNVYRIHTISEIVMTVGERPVFTCVEACRSMHDKMSVNGGGGGAVTWGVIFSSKFYQKLVNFQSYSLIFIALVAAKVNRPKHLLLRNETPSRPPKNAITIPCPNPK